MRLLVTLDVSDFELFEEFERKAKLIMHRYGGEILEAFETERQGNSGQEIHLIEFPDELSFERYKNDTELNQYLELRKKAVSKTEIKYVGKSKNYGQN